MTAPRIPQGERNARRWRLAARAIALLVMLPILAGILALTAPAGRTAVETAARRRWFWPAAIGLLVLLAAASLWRIIAVDNALMLQLYW